MGDPLEPQNVQNQPTKALSGFWNDSRFSFEVEKRSRSHWGMDARKKRLIDACFEARKLLAEAQIPNLEYVGFPILEMKDSFVHAKNHHGRNHLGFCESLYTVGAGGVSVSTRAIHLRLQKSSGELFPLWAVLPTFLHELAHATVPFKRYQSPGTDQNVDCSHGTDFYLQFARILETSERLGIFVLPARPNKFSMPSLLRFDALDLEEVSQSLCGYSILFPEIVPHGPLRLTLVHGSKHTRKTVSLEERSWEGLQQLARRKYQTKFTRFQLKGADTPLSLTLDGLKEGDEVWVHK